MTGKPLFSIQERPTPESDMPGEVSSPTQPFPSAPPAFARQKLTADEINPYILTPEERARWKDTIANARNRGLFTPPSMNDTVAIPGARGGANWGSTSVNPNDGTLYVASFDAPSIYKMSLDAPGSAAARARFAAAAAAGSGRALYQQGCQSCHGVNGAGTGASPSLEGVVQRLGAETVQQIILGGRGEMPPFQGIPASDLNALVTYLSDPDGTGTRPNRSQEQPAKAWTVPVAGSGGVPIGKQRSSSAS